MFLMLSLLFNLAQTVTNYRFLRLFFRPVALVSRYTFIGMLFENYLSCVSITSGWHPWGFSAIRTREPFPRCETRSISSIISPFILDIKQLTFGLYVLFQKPNSNLKTLPWIINESGKQHNSARFENLLISGGVVLNVFCVHGLFIHCNNVWLTWVSPSPMCLFNYFPHNKSKRIARCRNIVLSSKRLSNFDGVEWMCHSCICDYNWKKESRDSFKSFLLLFDVLWRFGRSKLWFFYLSVPSWSLQKHVNFEWYLLHFDQINYNSLNGFAGSNHYNCQVKKYKARFWFFFARKFCFGWELNVRVSGVVSWIAERLGAPVLCVYL